MMIGILYYPQLAHNLRVVPEALKDRIGIAPPRKEL